MHHEIELPRGTHHHFKSKLSWLLLALSLLWAPAASAQNATIAEALFEDGRRLYDEGKFEAACEKFAESQKLDPGTGTLLNLANCYEKAGRLATAWATWKEAASSARSADQADREAHARDRAKKLSGRVARLTLSVPEPHRVDGLVVRQGEREQNAAIWGTALPVDAGTYRIEAAAPGHASWAREVTVADGEKKVVEIPLLAPADRAAAVFAESDSTETDGPERDEADASSESGRLRLSAENDPMTDDAPPGRGRRVAGLITGGVGIVLTGVGAVFGVDALDKNEQSKEQCRPEDPNLCTLDGQWLREDAQTSALASTVLIGVGAAALTTGLVLFFTAPKAKTQVAAAPSLGGGRLLIQGSF